MQTNQQLVGLSGNSTVAAIQLHVYSYCRISQSRFSIKSERENQSGRALMLSIFEHFFDRKGDCGCQDKSSVIQLHVREKSNEGVSAIKCLPSILFKHSDMHHLSAIPLSHIL